ncbi:MAG: 50S ribosomal protein L11 methyltransferase [Burkholderiales bacterium]
MTWASLEFEIDAPKAEALADALLELGALSVDSEDAAAGTALEKPIFDEPGEDPAFWPRLKLRLLAHDPQSARQLLTDACSQVNLPMPATTTLQIIAETDWVRQTQAQFEPQKISDRLWIVPSWHAAPDPTAINIKLDPGLAFGTGSHPTTRLCLEWLVQSLRGGESVLDYGCGSGILAIAALKLGAGRVVGVDVDPVALDAARANVLANSDEAHPMLCEFADVAVPLNFRADIVVANILANPLRLLAPALAEHTRPGGKIALAGILTPQAEELAGIYGQWFDLEPIEEREGWVRIAGPRRVK